MTLFQSDNSHAFKWITFRKPWVNMTTHVILARFTVFDVGHKVCTLHRFNSFWCVFYTFGICPILYKYSIKYISVSTLTARRSLTGSGLATCQH